ncbi:hypothetical protein PAECIP111893_03516 [Paenibacillus plantiphilus]|uniref:LysM domain-containing protein n=1 Tax=Paenibacillus plantiphilus TaxID=2905650 RepID=A0ABM9CI99_9BACL|nr:LysM peptidoglycan-binding domain-containing protein [Paenibacillus plantiphilus]CAH1212296.1 hypothetical protein PAECIP111893_03516 [Paenibacillus plantiphilus]
MGIIVPAYQMSLSYNNQKEAITFPVLPEKLGLNRKGSGKTHDIVGIGEVNVIGNRELAEISFESFFPAQAYSFVTYPESGSKATEPESGNRLLPAIEFVNFIARWQDSPYPSRFIFTGPNFPINLPVSITKFDRWEVAGQPGDIYFNITMKEYVFHSAQKIKVITGKDGKKNAKTEDPKRSDDRARPATYTIKAGDTLIGIARLILNDDKRWRELQKLNGITDKQVRTLKIGSVIKIPKD